MRITFINLLVDFGPRSIMFEWTLKLWGITFRSLMVNLELRSIMFECALMRMGTKCPWTEMYNVRVGPSEDEN